MPLDFVELLVLEFLALQLVIVVLFEVSVELFLPVTEVWTLQSSVSALLAEFSLPLQLTFALLAYSVL